MSRAEGTPVVVMDDRVLGDVELILLGVLPTGHLLGGPVAAAGPSSGAGRRAVLATDTETAAAAAAAGRVLLVDEEQTPIASLIGVTTGSVSLTTDTPTISGELARERHRESGSGRAHRLDEADLTHAWGALAVLARPMTTGDVLPEAGGGTLLLVVPDDSAATDGVPTTTMLALARQAARRHGEAEIRTAPLRWRDPMSDGAVVRRLAGAVGLDAATLLHADPELDPGAPGWASARSDLEEAADTAPVPGIDPADAELLRRWRPPRPERGLAVMFTGLSGSGKSTLARALRERVSAETSRTVSLLDGDVVRHMLSAGLGFDRASRIMNVRRIGYVAAEVARHGGMALCAPIAPYAGVRADVRHMVAEVGDFVLVHVSTPLEECERRDLKGLYAAARAGRIPEFTGISDPYDVPDDPDVVVDTSTTSIDEGTDAVFRFLADGGWIRRNDDVD
jgi:sulfate adenylyltransferase